MKMTIGGNWDKDVQLVGSNQLIEKPLKETLTIGDRTHRLGLQEFGGCNQNLVQIIGIWWKWSQFSGNNQNLLEIGWAFAQPGERKSEFHAGASISCLPLKPTQSGSIVGQSSGNQPCNQQQLYQGIAIFQNNKILQYQDIKLNIKGHICSRTVYRDRWHITKMPNTLQSFEYLTWLMYHVLIVVHFPNFLR